MSDTSHYVITMSVERVDIGKSRTGGLTSASTAERTVTELARHIVRANVLSDAIERVKQHADLVDDIDAIDPVQRHKGNVR